MAVYWRWTLAVLMGLASSHMEATPTWHMSDFIAALEQLELSRPGAEPSSLLHLLTRPAVQENPFLRNILGPRAVAPPGANATAPPGANGTALPPYLARALAHRVRRDGREEGVVLTGDGTTVALGPVLLGLEAGLLSGAPRGRARALFQLTLAQPLALAARAPPAPLFPDGCWDSPDSPREFRLSGVSLVGPRALTTALVHGGMDGLVLGMTLASARPRGVASLSGLLRSYYGLPLISTGAPGLRASQRRDHFWQLVGDPPLLAKQVLRALDLQLRLEGRPKMKKTKRNQLVALVNAQMKEFVLRFMECPPIVPRCMWQAAPYRGTPTLLAPPLGFLYVHHTSTPAAPCLSFKHCAEDMRAMQRFHQDVRGWDDIGYSFVAGSDGSLYEGRGWKLQGAHTLGHNAVGYGVAFIGDYSSALPVDGALALVRDRLAGCAVATAALVANYTVHGHRQLVNTSCPGDALYREISGWEHFGNVTRV
ncbi:N-acetylmuramoyl-L-alanine amidase [Gadus morhua]|uniref:Peptidoglycan recognition protein 2 n=1 Tax=Gadus morhua TaxID=8049 RepID=A0A8C5CFL3_GADMO|nr:N-acetylmuramoyl-L-alanine amidase-like [Gadus morhua]XP_030194003.1 N-acetylmuramoyl-L-alanine amidase-like [Gadus morhua]